MKKTTFVASCMLAIAQLFVMSGCSQDSSSSVRTAGQAVETFEVTVVRRENVTIDGSGNNMAGMLIGGVAGGAVGSAFGGGSGKAIATAAGAALGAVGGAKIQESRSRQAGFEYTVRLANGSLRTVVQSIDNPLNVGQRAFLMIDNHRGESRLVAG